MASPPSDSQPAAAASEKFTIPPSENPSLGPVAKRILPHIFRLYDLSAGPADYEIYNKSAVFEDPLMKATGLKQIKSAFYSMQSLFSEAGIKEYSVTETPSGESSVQIVVDNLQHYKAFGRVFDVVSRINLTVDDGLVTTHQDLWDKKPLATRKTQGVMGWVSESSRAVNMTITHVLMGFGRDPKKPAA